MTRVKTSLCILSALIVLSIISGIRLNRRCEELLALTENIHACSDNSVAAAEAADRFQQSWQSFRRSASVMVKSDKLNEINRIASRIIPLIESGSEEISAELDELSEMIRVLQKGEKPLFTSVF